MPRMRRWVSPLLGVVLLASAAWGLEIPGPSAEAFVARPADAVFASVDRRAASAPASATASVATLGAYLSGSGSTDLERARAVYRWITANITYDAPALRGGPRPDPAPEAVLKGRKAVCEGFAALADALFRAMGMESVIIPGYSRGVGYRPGTAYGRDNHAWNAVRIQGRWALMDATWGSGYLAGDGRFQREFQPFYFLTPPERLIYSHLPRDPAWQLLCRPVAREDHAALPYLLPRSWELGVRPSGEPKASVECTGTARFVFEAPDSVAVSAQLAGSRRNVAGATFVQDESGQQVVRVEVPAAGEYTLHVFAAPRAVREMPEVMSMRVVATAAASPPRGFPQAFGSFRQRHASLSAPWARTLPAGAQAFRIRVPGARKVEIVQGSTWMPLTRSGEEFAGTVNLVAGKATVAASFAAESTTGGSESFEMLLQYQVEQ